MSKNTATSPWWRDRTSPAKIVQRTVLYLGESKYTQQAASRKALNCYKSEVRVAVQR